MGAICTHAKAKTFSLLTLFINDVSVKYQLHFIGFTVVVHLSTFMKSASETKEVTKEIVQTSNYECSSCD